MTCKAIGMLLRNLESSFRHTLPWKQNQNLDIILAAVRAERKTALTTATSGIAAILLDNGRTVHSHCKSPLSTSEDSTCHISKQGSVNTVFRQASLLVIDEVTTGHRHIGEAIDKTQHQGG